MRGIRLRDRLIQAAAVQLTTVALVAATPTLATLHAQASPDGQTGVQLTAYAGYAVFGNYFDAPAGARFTNEDAPLVGAQLSYRFRPTVAVVGHVGYASSTWRLEDVPVLGDVNLGDAGIWLYDVGLRVYFPLGAREGARFTPFAQAGAGAIRYTLGNEPLATLIGADDATTFAGNVGVGGDLALSPTVGLQFMVRDYIASFQSLEAGGFRAEGRVAHSWALTGGLTFGF